MGKSGENVDFYESKAKSHAGLNSYAIFPQIFLGSKQSTMLPTKIFKESSWLSLKEKMEVGGRKWGPCSLAYEIMAKGPFKDVGGKTDSVLNRRNKDKIVRPV